MVVFSQYSRSAWRRDLGLAVLWWIGAIQGLRRLRRCYFIVDFESFVHSFTAIRSDFIQIDIRINILGYVALRRANILCPTVPFKGSCQHPSIEHPTSICGIDDCQKMLSSAKSSNIDKCYYGPVHSPISIEIKTAAIITIMSHGFCYLFYKQCD